MPAVPGLRSPYLQIGRLVYFGRLLDKIRLHAAGRLPAEYQANLGDAQFYVLDGRCCSFLRVNYDELKARVLAGGLDEAQLLAWCHERGGARTDEECEVWNGFMMKRGWRDAGREILLRRIKESALEGRPVETMFDYLDFDEGRDPAAAQSWLQ